MPKKCLVLLSSVSLTLACKGATPPDDVAPQLDAGSPAEPVPAAVPVEPPAPAPTETKVDTPAAPEPAPAPEVAPPPEFVALPRDPNTDPMRVLLGGERPETVEILATHEHGRRRILLIRMDLAARWLASHPDDDPVVEALEEAKRACDEEPNMSGVYACLADAATLPAVPPELVEHLSGGESRAWELAEVELDRDGKARVLARKRLLDFAVKPSTEDPEWFEQEGLLELEVYDMDGDKRSEILVVFPTSMPVEDEFEENIGAVGFVLDRTDLHVQFATTRWYRWDWSDVSAITNEIETTWQTKDENADGHADLIVRENSKSDRDDSEMEERESVSKEQSKRSTVCLWELAGDRWVCPEWLGTKIVNGGKLVESTSVPIVIEPPTEAAPPAAN